MAQEIHQRDDWREKEFPIDKIFYFIAIAGVLILFGVWLGTVLFDADSVLPNIYTEVLSIAVTVLILNKLAERREENALKQHLRMNAGSMDNATAINAIREIKLSRWLFGKSGILQRTNFTSTLYHPDALVQTTLRANLQNAPLENANLQGSMMTSANLHGANLQFANLESVMLDNANLQGADLQGANLLSANLINVKVDNATRLINATLPDGEKFDEALGLSQLDRFISGTWNPYDRV